MLHETLKQKGSNCFEAAKVEGHATDEMVSAGKVEQKDKIGNDEADNFANEGVKLFGENVISLGAAMTSRHIAYTKMVERLHDTFIHAILKRNDLLEENNKRHAMISTDGVKKKAEVQLEIPRYADKGEQRLLNSMTDISNFKNAFKQPDKA